jgi:uncharacterized protein (TIGR02217 family)
VDIEMNATAGPTFDTTVINVGYSRSQRNINRDRQIIEFDIAYSINETLYQTVRTHFYNRRGMAHSFPFKDWSDYAMARQTIGAGDGVDTTFQIYKRYADGAYNYDRTITKPVTATAQVWVNSVLQTSGYTVSRTTGIVTFSVAPTVAHVIEVAGEFDVPVTYSVDACRVLMASAQFGSIASLGLIERPHE